MDSFKIPVWGIFQYVNNPFSLNSSVNRENWLITVSWAGKYDCNSRLDFKGGGRGHFDHKRIVFECLSNKYSVKVRTERFWYVRDFGM